MYKLVKNPYSNAVDLLNEQGGWVRTLYPGHILPEIFACFSFNGSVQCMRDAEDLVDSVLKMDYIPVEVEYDSSRLNGKHLSDFNRN